jgi:hypothetical protein
MKKSEVMEKLMQIASTLEIGMVEAKETSEKYSTEGRSRLAFEVGYLSGVIKGVVAEIKEMK